MTISKTHHIDASEPNEQGTYDYYYAYTVYVFAQADVEYTARSYDDEPQKVAFVGKGVNGTTRRIVANDLNSPLFTQAVRYLKTSEGKGSFWFLDSRNRKSGYTQIAVA
jgi:hypothetical protein